MRYVVSGMKLKVRVVHYHCHGVDCWYADIDDAGDRQPDDPYWYGYYTTQRAAIDAACARLAAYHLTRAERISHQLLSTATTSA